MSDFDLPLEFGKKASSPSSSAHHHQHESSDGYQQHHHGGHRGRGRGRGRGGWRGGGGGGFHAHHNNNNNNNARFSGHKRPFDGARGGGHHRFSNALRDGNDDVSVERYFSASMLRNPWRAWLEPDAADDESVAASTVHDSVVVDAPPANLHDLIEYTSEAGQRRLVVRVSGPYDGTASPVVSFEAGRLMRVTVAAGVLRNDQVEAVDQLFVAHTGHDRLRREALVALAARESSDWTYVLALPTAVDSSSMTSGLVACPVRDSDAAQRLLFVDVGVPLGESLANIDTDDVPSSPSQLEPQSPPPETEDE
jgi:hypothetical protein